MVNGTYIIKKPRDNMPASVLTLNFYAVTINLASEFFMSLRDIY
jgi:hypothetical protein